MLKQVLKSIFDGCSSVKQIAENLGMQESAVVNALRTLKNQGYLSPESGECLKDSQVCRNCPIAKNKPNLGVSLCITEKGTRFLKKITLF